MIPNKVRTFGKIWREFGPRWIGQRLIYGIRLHTGMVKRATPSFTWADRPLETWLRRGILTKPHNYADYAAYRRNNDRRFLFETLPKYPAGVQWNVTQAVSQADDMLAGQWQFFNHHTVEIGFPPSWHLDYTTGYEIQADQHWSRISDFEHGDIKLYWETNRCAWVYTLVRAYAHTRDERYPTAFWQLVEDWAAGNPPHRGPNWKCSQEASIRLMAWIFGLYAFDASPHTTPARIAALVAMIAAHAQRISRFLDFARSQGGNHIITEGALLWTVGILFPELAHAEEYRSIGRRVVELEGPPQIYADGAYEMHSFNYHRSVLHTFYWALRLGELNGQRLASTVYDAVDRSVKFLYQMMDAESGTWPVYGRNDGSLLLPLNSCDHRDFRPTLQLGHYLTHGIALLPPGPWDEDVFWFTGGEQAPSSESAPEQISVSFRDGGYYTLRGAQTWAMIRCAYYRHRPYEADQLHMDMWWRGINVTCEPGTYRYNAPGHWNHGLNRTLAHNTVTVDDQGQMLRASRFMWLDRAQGRVTAQFETSNRQLQYWEGEHDGYFRLSSPVKHRRGILRLGDEHWLVLDHLQSKTSHKYQLHWLLPDLPYQLATNDTSNSHNMVRLGTLAGEYTVSVGTMELVQPAVEIMRADEDSVLGWRSLYYNEKRPALSLLVKQQATSVLFWTVLGPPLQHYQIGNNKLYLDGTGWQAQITLDVQAPCLVLRASLHSDRSEDQVLMETSV